MKRLCLMIIALCLLLGACGTAEYVPDEAKLQIVCSSFPAYDFARELAGERAELLLLLKPGAEVHSYEPTPKDMVRIQGCDLFIYNGGESEEWVEDLAEDMPNALCMMDCVEALEESDEGIYKTEEGEEEETELDEHVWTSPINAIKICNAICAALCELEPESAEDFNSRLFRYVEELNEIDAEIREVIKASRGDTLIFADRFPMRYFALEYGLRYFAAFPGCATETEASAKTVAFLIDKVRENDILAVLYMEFSNERMADVICEDTGCKKLPFYSAHSVTVEQFKAGLGYTELMRINIKSLKEALG